MSKRWWVVLVCGAMYGCGDLTAGGLGEGEIRTIAVSEPAAASGTARRTPAAPGVSPRGTVTFSSRIILVNEEGAEVPLTPGAVTATVRIEGGDSALLARTRIAAGRYVRARIAFSAVSAEVTGGLIVDGIPVLGRIDVATGAETVIEAPVQLQLDEETEAALVLDVNAAEWLASLDLLSRTVAEARFQEAVEVRIADTTQVAAR